jgi:hypothetical protein
MKRRLLAAGLAIAVLFGGSITLVLFWTGRAGPAGPPPGPADSEAPLPPVEPAATPLPRAAAAAGPMKLRASSWNAPGEGPSSSPMASRVVRKVVRKALLAAPIQSRLARCADRIGGYGGTAAQGPVPRGKPAVLVLELEARGSEVRILDAQVQRWGEASEASVSCARSVLEGRVVPAPKAREERGPAELDPARGAEPERMRMPFPLNPRSEMVASFR